MPSRTSSDKRPKILQHIPDDAVLRQAQYAVLTSIASRAVQDSDNWSCSLQAERAEIITWWKVMQDYLQKKGSLDELMLATVQAQRGADLNFRTSSRNGFSGAGIHAHGRRDMPLPTSKEDLSSPHSSEVAPQAPAPSGPPPSTTVDNADVDGALQELVSHFQSSPGEDTDQGTHENELRRAIEASKIDARRQAIEASEHEKELQRILAQSLAEHSSGSRIRGSSWNSAMDLNDQQNDEFERELDEASKKAGKLPAVPVKSPRRQQRPMNDAGHLAGTTTDEFEGRQHGEKAAQEETEEQIVMEYVRKLSMLEAQHGTNGKAREVRALDGDEEELQRASELSLRGQHGGGHAGSSTLQAAAFFRGRM